MNQVQLLFMSMIMQVILQRYRLTHLINQIMKDMRYYKLKAMIAQVKTLGEYGYIR